MKRKPEVCLTPASFPEDFAEASLSHEALGAA